MTKVLGEFKSARKIDTLRRPKSGKVYWKDAGQPGLYLSMSASGKRAWECQLKVNGKPRWKTVGYYHKDGMSLTDARKCTEDARERAQAGLDPWPKEDALVFSAVWTRFMGTHFRGKGPRATEPYVTLRRRIGSTWDDKRIETVSKADIWNLLDDVADQANRYKHSRGGLSAVNNAYKSLQSFFRWAWARDLVKASPMAGLQVPHEKAERERDLQADELAAIWRAAGQERHPYRHVVQLDMILPGRIWSEIAMLKRSDVRDGRWNHHTTKTGRSQWLPLPQMALDILRDCPEVSDFYFDGSITGTTRVRLKARLDERCKVANWVFHDFREAFMTRLGDLGAPLDLADEIQRPKAKRKTIAGRHYDRSSREEQKGEVLEFWSYVVRCYLDGIYEPTPKKQEPDKRYVKRWREWLQGAEAVPLRVVANG